jgi:hypothetical protein
MGQGAEMMVKNKKDSRFSYAISLKPTPEVREKLRAAADAAGRTLTKEMELRLAASVRGDIPSAELYAGWPPEDQMRFRSLGNMVGLLCANVTLTTGTGTPSPYVLGAVRAALSQLFEAVGATAIEGDYEKFYAMVARQMLANALQAASMDAPTGEKAAFADFASAWGIRGEKLPPPASGPKANSVRSKP